MRPLSASGLAVVLALLGGCDGTEIPGRVDLLVRAPVGGTVRVADRFGRIDASGGQTLLAGVGPPPYVVHFEHGGERLTLLDVPGPVVDLRWFVPRARPIRGALAELCVLPEPAAGASVAVFDGTLRLEGSAEDDGRWCFRGPLTRPLEVLALWPDGFARARVEGLHSEAVEISPQLPLDGETAVALAGAPPGLVRVELTWLGQRTGLVLGEGLALPGSAVGVPRPDAVESLGLWAGATARAVGEARAVARAEAHLPIDADGLTLAWDRPVSMSPAPKAPEVALPLRREPRSLRWESPTADATYLDLELVADDGCERSSWRVVAPAAGGSLSLPRPPGPDPLAAALLEGRLERVTLGPLTWEDLVGPDPPDAVSIGRSTPRVGRRVLLGAWRGGPSTCEEDARAGIYAAYSGSCDAGGEAPRVWVDRCGVMVGLDDDARALLECRRLVGDEAVGERDAWPVAEALGGLRVDRPGRPLRLVPLDTGPGARPPAGMVGDWFRASFTRQSRSARDGSVLGVEMALPPADVEGGPWLHVDAAGRLELRTPAMSFSGRLEDWDGLEGSVRVLGAGCEARPREVTVSFDGDALVLTELRSVSDEVDERRVARLER